MQPVSQELAMSHACRDERPSAGTLETDALAVLGDRAAAAPGRDRDAEVLPEGDQEIVVGLPVASRELGPQGKLGLLRGLGAHVTPEVRDAMDVRVDADAVLVVA